MKKKDYIVLLEVALLVLCGICLIVGIAVDSLVSLLYALFLGGVYAVVGIVVFIIDGRHESCEHTPMPPRPPMSTNTASYVGKSVQELQEFATVISITRNGRYITPTLDTVIQPDDIVILRV